MGTKFYTFRQNNSGGEFTHDHKEGIGVCVIVEAQNAAHALNRAERIGLYFDGCATGMDCPCCGDRWSDYVDDEDGTDAPEVYGQKYEACAEGDEAYKDWGLPYYVHYIGGEFKPLKQVEA